MEESSSGRGIGNFQEVGGDYTPRLGQEFSSDHEAYEFCRYYAWKLGFSIRREYANKSRKTGEISSRKFACSREGFKAPDKGLFRSRGSREDPGLFPGREAHG